MSHFVSHYQNEDFFSVYTVNLELLNFIIAKHSYTEQSIQVYKHDIIPEGIVQRSPFNMSYLN